MKFLRTILLFAFCLQLSSVQAQIQSFGQSITGPNSGTLKAELTKALNNDYFLNAAATALDRNNLHFAGNATNTATLFNEIIETNDGRLLGLLSVFGASLGDFTDFTLKGTYSSDRGKTWGTPFVIVGKEGTEIANAIPSVHKQANGTLVMLFWRDLVEANPRLTQICKKTSTDNGLTWSATSVVYVVGAYSAPHGSRIFKANDGTLYYAFNEWTGSTPAFDYGSQNGNYIGRLLKSIDDGTTWTFVNLSISDPTTNAVLEPGLFQYPNEANGTVGRAYMYYRTRGGFMGLAYSDDNFVTWTAGSASKLAAHNIDLHARYLADIDAIIVFHGRINPWAERATDISVSYDRGTNWYKIFNVSELGTGFRSAAAAFFLIKDLLLFPYYKSNSTQSRYDDYIFYSNISAFTSVNPANPLPLYNGKTQQLAATTRIITGGGFIVDDFLIGKTTKEDPNDLLSVNNTTGVTTRVVFGNDVNANGVSTLLKFSKTRAGAAPNNSDAIGQIQWNNKIQVFGQQNIDTHADLVFATDQTGGGFVNKTKFLATGQWVYGDAAGGLNPIRANGLTTFRATGRNTEISIGNADANTNLSEIYFEKTRGSSYTLTAGDVVGQLSFNTLSYIKAIANATTVGGFTNNDLAFFGANAAGTVAERVRITGPGDVGIGVVSPNSTTHINGSFATAYAAKTAAYTLTSADYTIEITSGTHTQTLPTAVGIAGRIYVITNSGAGVVTIGTTSSQTFINVSTTPTTLTLNQFQTAIVQSNGANWLRIGFL